MLELGTAEITLFFTFAIICLIFVITWVVKSEAKRNTCKEEIKRLKAQMETAERERFILLEKNESLRNTVFTPEAAQKDSGAEGRIAGELAMQDMKKRNEALGEENERLKKELQEARASLEEVYKALS